VPSGRVWYGFDGRKYAANDEGEIILETLEAGGTVVLFENKSSALKHRHRLDSADVGMTVIEFHDAIYVAKKVGTKPEKLPIQVPTRQPLFDVFGRKIPVSELGNVLTADVTGEKEIVFFKKKSALRPKKQQPDWWESLNMVFQRALLFLKHNRKALIPEFLDQPD